MQDFLDRRVRQDPLEIGAVIIGPVHLYDMGIAITGRKLDHAQHVAREGQAESFRIDRDNRAEVDVCGQVALVIVHGHGVILVCPSV